MEELEKENALLKSEKEELNQRILQQSNHAEGETPEHGLVILIFRLMWWSL